MNFKVGDKVVFECRNPRSERDRAWAYHPDCLELATKLHEVLK